MFEEEEGSRFCNDPEAVASTHLSLLEAEVSLNQLADYCEDNYFAPNSMFLEEDEHFDAQSNSIKFDPGCTLTGSECFLKTGEIAVQALHALVYNVGCLAEDLDQKLTGMLSKADLLSADVAHLTMRSNVLLRKQELSKMKQLTTPTKDLGPGKRYCKFKEKSKSKDEYERKSVDYSVYDQIGSGGLAFRLKCANADDFYEPMPNDREFERSTSVVSVTSSTGFATLRKPKFTKAKKAEMPKFPCMPSSPIKPLRMSLIPPPELFDNPEQDNQVDLRPKDDAQGSDNPGNIRLTLLPPLPNPFEEAEQDQTSLSHMSPIYEN